MTQLALVSVFLPILCASARALPAAVSSAVKNPETFVYAQAYGFESSDPSWAIEENSLNVVASVYEFLLTYQGTGTLAKDLVPSLSEKVPSRSNGLISAGGTVYRFPIRKGVKFHDGSALTPEDVRYSLLRFMLSDHAGGLSSSLLQPILGIDSTRSNGKIVPGVYEDAAKAVTVDNNTIVVRLKRPFAPFLSVLTRFGAVVSKDWCARHGQWDGRAQDWEKFNDSKREEFLPNGLANGTGPFRLAHWSRDDKEVVLERNDAYWKHPALLKTVVLKAVDEFVTRKLMLNAGDADAIEDDKNLPQLLEAPGVDVAFDDAPRSAQTIVFTLNINPVANRNVGSGRLDGKGIPPDFFSDADVRQAFASAIDYATCRDLLHAGGPQPAGLIPPGMLGYNPGPPKYTFDLAASREHFKKAWAGKVWENGFMFSVPVSPGGGFDSAIFQMLKKNVELINPKFHVDLRTVTDDLEQRYQRKLPMDFGQWGGIDPNDVIVPFLRSTGFFSTYHGEADPSLDAAIDKAAGTLDEGKRAALYVRLQEAAAEKLLFVPIAFTRRERVQRSWVKGYVLKPAFLGPYDYYDLLKD